MFDRGFVSVDDDYRILVTGQELPEEAGRLLRQDGYAQVPCDIALQPQRQFLAWHRDNVFKS